MILCKLYQWKMRWASTPANVQAGSRMAGHLKHCPTCQAYLHRLTLLEEHLRTAPPKGLLPQECKRIETAVLNSLQELPATVTSGRYTLPATARPAFRNPAFAAAAMLLIAALLFVTIPRRPEPAPPQANPLSSLWSDSEQITNNLKQLIFLPERSLQTELTRLSTDARQAVAFLVNCAPSHPLPENANGL